MLKNLFASKCHHADPLVREQAIKKELDQNILASIVQNDPLTSLRSLALEHLIDIEILSAMLATAKSGAIWLAIAFRLNAINAREDALLVDFSQRMSEWAVDDIATILCAQTDNELAYQMLLATKIPDLDYRIAISQLKIDSRLAAITQMNTLETLNKVLKNTSQKLVIQACKARIEHLRDAQKHAQQTYKDAQQIIHLLQQLSSDGIEDAFYATRLAQLEQRWAAIDHRALNTMDTDTATDTATDTDTGTDSSTMTHAYRSALERCQVVQTDQQQRLIRQAEEQRQAALQTELCEQLQALTRHAMDVPLSASGIEHLEAASADLNAQWQHSLTCAEPSAACKEHYLQQQQLLAEQFDAWRRLTDFEHQVKALCVMPPEATYEAQRDWLKSARRIQSGINWPNELQRPRSLSDARDMIANVDKKQRTVSQQANKKVQAIRQKIVTLQRHCQNRDLAAANKLAAELEEHVAGIPEELRTPLERKYGAVQEQLNELRDWHVFATEPKKDQLCEAMEALCIDVLEPLEQAKRIRALEEDWRKLTASHALTEDDKALRFRAARHTAFKPCQTYYDEQNQIKTAHYNQREALLGEIENGLQAVATPIKEEDSPEQHETPVDWRQLDKDLLRIQREWDKLLPVPEKNRRQQEARYERASRRLRHAINSVKQRNLQTRRELVTQAEKLLTETNPPASIDQIKELQRQWKDAGMTFHKADREQWKLFRGLLDQVFANRDQAKRAHTDELTKKAQQLTELISQIDRLRSLSDAELKISHTEFVRLYSSWDTQTELPRETAKQLLKRFEVSGQKYRKHYAGIKQRASQTSFRSLLQGADILSEAEAKFLEGSDDSMTKSQLDDLAQSLDDLDCDAEGAALLAKRLEQLTTARARSVNVEGAEQLQSIALECEIMLGIDSPASEKSARMQLQLQRLQKGLGQATSPSQHRTEVLKATHRWIAVNLIKRNSRTTLEVRREKIFSAVGL